MFYISRYGPVLVIEQTYDGWPGYRRSLTYQSEAIGKPWRSDRYSMVSYQPMNRNPITIDVMDHPTDV